MEGEKRKREGDGRTNGKVTRAWEEGDGVKVPGDEEVEEFFAILKRIQVAVKYFQERNGGRSLTVRPWSPSFEREDFDGVVNGSESSERKPNGGLDLNSDPAGF